MIVWLDNQLSPSTAIWMRAAFGVDCVPLRDLGFQCASDRAIFDAARAASAIVMTKDADFVELLRRDGAPPRVIWVTCGNTANQHLRGLILRAWPSICRLLEYGETLIELDEPPHSSP